MKRHDHLRKERGAMALPEFAATLVVGLPLLILIIFTALEISSYLNVKTKIDISARAAARQLAIAYGQNPSIVTDTAATNTIYQRCLIPQGTADVSQFTATWNVAPSGGGTVTVLVKYPCDGSFGLPILPAPDPLRLANVLQPSTAATFALER